MWRIAILLFTIGFIPLQVLAWGVNTHFAITKVAAEKSENLKYFLETFGLQNGLPKKDCEVDAHPSQAENQGYDIYVDPNDSTKKPKNQGFLELASYLSYDGEPELTYTIGATQDRKIIVGCTAFNVIGAGAVLEDSNPNCEPEIGNILTPFKDQTIDNICRSLRHFFDPIDGDGTSGKSNARDWAINGDVDDGNENLNVFKWSDDNDPNTKGDNDLSSFDHFKQAIIAPTRAERVIGKQRLFVTLGHVAHLLEDMFQPAHVRNDNHGGSLLTGGTEVLEKAIQEHVAYEGYGSENEVTYANISKGVLAEKIAKEKAPIVETVAGLFDDAARFTNKNFFSTDTIFDDYDHLSHSFSGYDSPNENNTFPREEPVRFKLASGKIVDADRKFIISKSLEVDEITNINSKTQSDFKSTKPRLTMEKAGLEKNDTKNCGPVKGIINRYGTKSRISSHTYCEKNNDLVILDNAMALLPKAVAYPKALINYFFRGKIEVTLVRNENMLLVKNISEKDNFQNGKLEIHYQTNDGNMHKHTEFSSFSLAKDTKIGLKFPSQSDNGDTIDFDNIVGIVAFYDGNIGEERGVAATSYLPLSWTGNASIISYHSKDANQKNHDYPQGITRDKVALHPKPNERPVGFFQWQVSKGSCDSLKITADKLSAGEKNVDITFGVWSSRDSDLTFKNVTLPFIIGEKNTGYTFSDDDEWYVLGVAFRDSVSKAAELSAICTTSKSPTSKSYTTTNTAIILDGSHKWNGNGSIISGMFTPLVNDERHGVFKDVTQVHPSPENPYEKPVVFFQWMFSEDCKELTIDAPILSNSEKKVLISQKVWDSDSPVDKCTTLPCTLKRIKSVKNGPWNVIRVAFDNPVSQTAKVEAKCRLKFPPTKITTDANYPYTTTEKNLFSAGQGTWYAYGRVLEFVAWKHLPAEVGDRIYNAFDGKEDRHSKNWPNFLSGDWIATSATNPLPKEKRQMGLLAVWSDGTYGHVGFVEEVNTDKTQYRLSSFNRFGGESYQNDWYDFEGTSGALSGYYPQFYNLTKPNW